MSASVEPDVRVIIRLKGGLGNQLFQYAMGRCLAMQLGARLILDRREVLPIAECSAGQTAALEAFSIRAELSNGQGLERYPDWQIRHLWYTRKFIHRWSNIYFERCFGFAPISIADVRNRMLVGYWQSDRFFQPIAEELRHDLTLAAPLPAAAWSLVSAMQEPGSIAMHIRRGDYLANPRAQRIHGVCGLDYYQQAIDLMISRNAGDSFFVFSDDPDWARANLRIPGQVVMVSRPEFPAHVDLHLMGCAKHHIIANSSFSWWGAWLGASPDQIVVAPEPWFNLPSLSGESLYRDGWVRLSRGESGRT